MQKQQENLPVGYLDLIFSQKCLQKLISNKFLLIVTATVRKLYAQTMEKQYRKNVVIWLNGTRNKEGGRKVGKINCAVAANSVSF